jgi:hypothetical protein
MIANRRTKCGAITRSDPKLSPLHETGVGPGEGDFEICFFGDRVHMIALGPGGDFALLEGDHLKRDAEDGGDFLGQFPGPRAAGF